MDNMWEYNAPQYVDFTKRLDDDRADAYFGTIRSIHGLPTCKDVRSRLSRNTAPAAQPKIGLPYRGLLWSW